MLDNVSVLFKLEEQLLALVKANPGLAVALVFVILLVGANIAVTQILEFRKYLHGQWLRRPLAWVGLAAGACVVLVLSTGIVRVLRESTEPVPALEEEPPTTFVGVPLRLQWSYVRQAPRFEIQSSKDASFAQEVRQEGYRNGSMIRVNGINASRYWRVRAVDSANAKMSGWSAPIKIDHYDSSLIRIQKTGLVSIYMSDSINEAFFKFEAKDVNSTLKGYDVAIADEITKNLGPKLGIKEPLKPVRLHVAWQDLLDAPASGKADIIISTITAFPEREAQFGLKFSRPYYCTTHSLVYRAPQKANLPVPQLIAGKRVGVQSKTTSEALLKEFIAENSAIQAVPFKQTDEVISALVGNKIDYGFTDTQFARAAQPSYQGVEVRELIDPADFPSATKPERRTQKYAIAVRAGETELIDAIDQIIDEMRKDRLGELLEAAVREFNVRLGRPAMSVGKQDDPSTCRTD